MYEILALVGWISGFIRRDSMLNDISVGLIALGFVAMSFVGACLCDIFRVRREQRQAEYLPRVKRVDARGKIPSGIAE